MASFGTARQIVCAAPPRLHGQGFGASAPQDDSLAGRRGFLGRPLVSETAGSLYPGSIEIEAAWAKADLRGGRHAHAGDLMVQHGLGFSSQMGLGYTRASGAEALLALQFAGKSTLVPPRSDQIGWDIAYRATAIKTEGGSYETRLLTAAALMTRELGGRWLLHLNLRITRNRIVHERRLRWWVGIERPGTLVHAADLFGHDAGESFFSTGVGWALTPTVAINAAAAWQLGGGSARDVAIGLRVAY